ncbi:hypothetical protein [Proteiniclasticum sp.]|uniref:hypothetical protein n=1 Tax=Proteiniclasticum sp. TaxID=2053595 RepID=UPI0028A1C47B|nr:hypothetical protein [Proteiniclasticum sp.]
MKRRFVWSLISIMFISVLIFVFSPAFARNRSLISMFIYDRYQEQGSVQKMLGYHLDFPLEKMDLYPLMISYNDSRVSSELNKDVTFTVEYSFGDFKKDKGYSRILDFQDPLYNAYIGSYSVLGFGEKMSDADLADISRFDMTKLALPALGLEESETSFEILEQGRYKENHMISGRAFTVYKSTVMTNGSEHAKDDFPADDLLYGSMDDDPTISFPLRIMKGRIYHHYFEETDLNLVLFALGKSEVVLDDFEELIVNHVRIEFQNQKD